MRVARGLVACGMVAILVGGVASSSAYGSPADELAQASEQLDSLGAELDELRGSLANLTNDVEMTDYEIAEKEDQLVVLEQRLAENRATLAGRMRSAYKAGPIDLIQVLLDARGFDDLVDCFFLLDKIAENDAKTIQQAHDAQQEVEEQKAELEAKRSEQSALLTELQGRVLVYQDKVAEAQAYYEELDAEVQAEIARKQREEENARIQAALEAAEQARLEQERKEASEAGEKEAEQEDAAHMSEEADEGAESTSEAEEEQSHGEESAEDDKDPTDEGDKGQDGEAEHASPDADESDSQSEAADEGADDEKDAAEQADSDVPDGEGSEPVDESEAQEDVDGEPADSEAYGGSGVASAQSCLGLPYVYGAAGPDSFDCSGLVCYCYGYDRGRSTYDMIASLKDDGSWKTSMDKLKYGDLVFTSVGHVGIYVGNGQMIHAPHEGLTVSYSDVYAFIGGGSY